jgi:hypothetical protein
VSENGGVFLVVHEQEFEVGGVVDEELLVAGRNEVSGLFVGSVTDLGHGGLSLESSSHLVVSRVWGEGDWYGMAGLVWHVWSFPIPSPSGP